MTITRSELARLIDHSVLKPEAVEGDVEAGADIVRKWQIGYFCVQPCWVSLAAHRLAGTTAMVASVIGFPHGADRPDMSRVYSSSSAHGRATRIAPCIQCEPKCR